MPKTKRPHRFALQNLSLSTRAELMILLLCVILPFSGLLVYGVIDRYRLLQADARHDALFLAKSIGDRQSAVILHTRLLLKSLATDPVVRNQDWKGCNALLKDFHQRFGNFYTNIHLARASGDVVCSGAPYPYHENVGDRPAFQHALKTGKMVIGDFIVSRITGLQALNVRYPIKNESGATVAILSAQISAEQFNHLSIADISLPQNGELFISTFDDGIVLDYPYQSQWLGRHVPPGRLYEAIRHRREGVVEAAGLDGVPRIYAFTRLGSEESEELCIVVGFPQELIESNVQGYLLVNLLVALAAILLAIFIAWFGVERLVLGKIRGIVDTVLRFKSGERSARTGFRYGRDELSHIARAVDDMAAELEQVMDAMREQAIRDPLTKLYNRRFMEESLMRELATAKRQRCHLGVIIADLDRFKRINDSFGHECGDLVLASVAAALMANVRAGDIVCRYGGEEFAIIMQDTDAEVAVLRSEMLREAVAALKLHYAGQALPRITASFGVAVYPVSGDAAHSLLNAADAALYEAKRAGRNRVVKASAGLADSADAPP